MKSRLSIQRSAEKGKFFRGLHCERALNLSEFEKAFQIIHASYSQRAFIPPNVAGIWMSQHHLLAETCVFLARDAKQACGTLTLVQDGRLGIPMETLFGKEVHRCREENGSIAEATCLALEERGATNGPKIVNHLMGAVAQTALASGIRQILITVHPRHSHYYIRQAGFKAIGPTRPYPAVQGHLAVPLALHLPTLRKEQPVAYRRYFGMQFSEETLAAQPTPSFTLQKLALLWRSIPSERLPQTSTHTAGTRSAA